MHICKYDFLIASTRHATYSTFQSERLRATMPVASFVSPTYLKWMRNAKTVL